MKKYIIGIITAIAIIVGLVYYCSSDEKEYKVGSWWEPEKKKEITWTKLDTIVVGDGLFKLEYPECFILDDEGLLDSSVCVKYQGKEDTYLTASVSKNTLHGDTQAVADSIVKQRREEGLDSITMQDMHDGYFYLKGNALYDNCRFYEQFVVGHDFIYNLYLSYKSYEESKMDKLFQLVHEWRPYTNPTYKTYETSQTEGVKERLSVLKKRGGAHNYREFFIEEGEYSYHFMVYDSCHHSKQEIVFEADDYLNDGTPGMYAFVSPDKRYVYVVGDILANSTGWTSTFIIYQVNTETLKAKLVNAVAAVRQEKNGFKVAELSRCLTPDTVPSYQMEFTFRDVTYNFNGKVIKRSAEYSPIEIKKRYGKSLINIKGLGIMRGQDD
jgi:hypothetical protein